MLDFVIFAVTFVVILFILVIWLYPTSRKVTTVPGLEPSNKDDGNLSDITRAGSLHMFLIDLHKQFGPIASFWMGEQLVVSIASPELFKQQMSVFDRPGDLFQIIAPLCGPTSIQFLNGAEGRGRRQLYDKSFLHENLHVYTEGLQKISKEMVTKWGSLVKEEHIPLQQYMKAFATKVVLQCTLGAFFLDDKEVFNFKQHFDKAWSELEHRLQDPSIPPEDSPRGKAFREVLTWCLYFLASHPTIQDKLKQELSGAGDFSPKSLEKLRYLRQVLEETFRCAVIVPWAARYQDFDSELGGHKISKRTPVVHALGVVLQDDNLWPLPNKFDPDRFSVENGKDRPTLAFAPFGFAGKRLCPAKDFVYLEAAVLVASLVSKFKVSLVEGQVVNPVYGLVTKPEDEIWVTVQKRN
ncbi:cytochrome P450 20A1-like isoform X2 [Pomacea canaliculata]|uniref:cytochrome P450 20A1-like isoform X2 n=1 Tax=Pomacea canaliculata TaxID=400727 RepID=UPI000D72AB79|nr:cytochrome P450 20A1-like isoform X2 [Pomacea canaliculata]